MLRNRRTIIFTLVLPAALLLAFGGQQGWDDKAGSGNVAAYILVSMAPVRRRAHRRGRRLHGGAGAVPGLVAPAAADAAATRSPTS